MSPFLAECCQGDQTRGQQSVLKILQNTVKVRWIWHNIYVATEIGGQMQAVVLLHVSAKQQPQKSKGLTLRCTDIATVIFPQISKTTVCQLKNKTRLLCYEY
jgi:hypothetical protein